MASFLLCLSVSVADWVVFRNTFISLKQLFSHPIMSLTCLGFAIE